MMPIIESQAQREALVADCKVDIERLEGYLTECATDRCALLKSAILRQKIALAALENDKCESATAGLLTDVRDSLSLNPHQNAVITCAIDRLNDYSKLLNTPPVPALKPVDLSGCYSYSSAYTRTAYISKEEVIKAIRTAGVQIAGEDNATTE